MVEAAVRGVVDFRQAKFFDPAWRRRVRLLLGGLRDLNYREELTISHDYYLQSMLIPDISPESFEGLQKAAGEIRRQLGFLFRPWTSLESMEAQKQKEQSQLKSLWERQWGKMDDPMTIQKIARTAAAMKAQREQVQGDISPDDIAADPKKRALARNRTGQPRRKQNVGKRSTVAGRTRQ